MVRAVVFDVGETLIDETRIFSRWADRLDVPRGTFLGLVGACAATDRPLADAFALARPGLDLGGEIDRWALEDPAGLRENFDADDLYADVRPALAALREAGLAVVVAGNQPPQARAALEAMDLPVDSIRTSDEWGVEKPAPEFFARVAELAGHPASQIAYVGDRLDNDVLPAADAGMRPVLIRRGPWGYWHATRPEAARVDVVDSLHELLALLTR
ncbi:HAD family hydrolase [Isoptericola sp. AK164]|uniref:HAD family hydrolase n=1 Tax=Isoptericola sp. AK164 TaxID=3024246 RepID=UPI0024188379|nr:HAD family hydrolase [Isoptericola sp. AK164]